MSTPTVTPVVTPTATKPTMPTCSCWLKYNKEGSNLHKHNITPAEMLFLVAEHHMNAGGNPISDISNEKIVERSASEEMDRLRTKYSGEKLSTLYSTPIPQFPASFKDAQELGCKLNIHSKNKFATISHTTIS